eukprot:scaffold3066_cov131-Skeletonema_menzelii.AAC.6
MSKSKLKPIAGQVLDSGDGGLDIENELNATLTPSNHKRKNRKISFQFIESPKVSKAKGNAAFA